jgi:hypothetical protein
VEFYIGSVRASSIISVVLGLMKVVHFPRCGGAVVFSECSTSRP